jgi:predicted DNA-binding transcriptional regulator YafY
LQALAQELGCSKPTVKRAIRELRELLGAPLDYDRERDGYYYARDEAAPFQLPGLWFSPDELYALLTTYRLLGQIQGGLLEEYIAPLRERIEALLKDDRAGHAQIDRRVRILPLASRQTDLQHFRHVANALVARRRMRILYHGRASDETTDRVVSPQRLVYYRDNWYLDAWCHKREGLRSFSVDRAHPLETLEEPALELDDAALDAHYAVAYGIFAGEATHTAHLRFYASAARWVADEQWHAHQESEVLPDGRLELRVPYSDPTELMMDILKYGPDVEVLGPSELRERVAGRLREASGRYSVAGGSGSDPPEG